MNEEEDMMSEVVGGNVFEFSTEIVNLVSGGAFAVFAIR